MLPQRSHKARSFAAAALVTAAIGAVLRMNPAELAPPADVAAGAGDSAEPDHDCAAVPDLLAAQPPLTFGICLGPAPGAPAAGRPERS